MTFLETDRLILRRFREEDLSDFFAYVSDPTLSGMTGLEDMSSLPAAKHGLDRLLKQPRAYALVLRDTGQVIGDLSVEDIPPVLEELEHLREKAGKALSFSLSRDYRRKGLMSEAVRAVIEHLFLEEHLDYVNCGYFAFNEASRALQKKLGFTALATHFYHQGNQRFRVIDNVIWREDWLAGRV